MTPEARAEVRFPLDDDAPDFDNVLRQRGYFTAIREQVEPLEVKVQEQADEVAKLRALVQVLVDRHGEVKWDAECCDWSCERCGNDYGMKETDLYDSTEQALSAAKEQGFVPTNTTTEGR
jgi:hypothetical protein